MIVAHLTKTGRIGRILNLVADAAINNDEVDNLVDDLNDKYAIHLNDEFDDIEDFVNI